MQFSLIILQCRAKTFLRVSPKFRSKGPNHEGAGGKSAFWGACLFQPGSVGTSSFAQPHTSTPQALPLFRLAAEAQEEMVIITPWNVVPVKVFSLKQQHCKAQ